MRPSIILGLFFGDLCHDGASLEELDGRLTRGNIGRKEFQKFFAHAVIMAHAEARSGDDLLPVAEVVVDGPEHLGVALERLWQARNRLFDLAALPGGTMRAGAPDVRGIDGAGNIEREDDAAVDQRLAPLEVAFALPVGLEGVDFVGLGWHFGFFLSVFVFLTTEFTEWHGRGLTVEAASDAVGEDFAQIGGLVADRVAAVGALGDQVFEVLPETEKRIGRVLPEVPLEERGFGALPAELADDGVAGADQVAGRERGYGVDWWGFIHDCFLSFLQLSHSL